MTICLQHNYMQQPSKCLAKVHQVCSRDDPIGIKWNVEGFGLGHSFFGQLVAGMVTV